MCSGEVMSVLPLDTPWTPSLHCLFPRDVQAVIVTLLLVAIRHDQESRSVVLAEVMHSY